MPESNDSETKIEAAIERLLEGKPLKSNGKLTKRTLAIEAGVGEATLYRQKSLLKKWDQKVAELAKPGTDHIQKLEERLSSMSLRNQELTQENKRLTQALEAAATVIVELQMKTQDVKEGSVAWLVPKKPRNLFSALEYGRTSYFKSLRGSKLWGVRMVSQLVDWLPSGSSP